MTTLIKLQEELQRALSTTEAWGPVRAKAMQSKIDYQNTLIDQIQERTTVRRQTLERKRLQWLKEKLDSLERDWAYYAAARGRANASNATNNLKNWK